MIIRLWLILGLLGLCPLVTTAATHQVSTSTKLKSALSQARPGDEIVLDDGAYAGNFRLTRGGTKEEPIVIRAKTRHRATFDGNSTFTDKANVGLTIKSPYVVVEGLRMEGLWVPKTRHNRIAADLRICHHAARRS